MIILTLFGTTTGLELQHFPLDKSTPTLKLEEAWIGVTPGQVILRAEKETYVLFRRTVDQRLVTWIGLYRPAREMGYDRPGGFYGAGVWIVDHVADSGLIVDLLCEMANQIQLKTMNGDRFIRNIGEVRGEFSPPANRSSLVSSLAKINMGFKTEGESAFIVENINPVDIIGWAQLAPSASNFSKAVIGASDQVAQSGQGGTLKLYTSLSVAIDAAYRQLLSDNRQLLSEFRNLSSERKNLLSEYQQLKSNTENHIQKLSQKIFDLEQEKQNLSDDLKDAQYFLQIRNSQVTQHQPINRSPTTVSDKINRIASGDDPSGGVKLQSNASNKTAVKYEDNVPKNSSKKDFYIGAGLIITFVALVFTAVYLISSPEKKGPVEPAKRNVSSPSSESSDANRLSE